MDYALLNYTGIRAAIHGLKPYSEFDRLDDRLLEDIGATRHGMRVGVTTGVPKRTTFRWLEAFAHFALR